ncbi:hypothetical protein NX774_09975 [Massilia agilis]|uniref:Porin n=1 Tax=Massilia agilis TaxID=1811226 RepID=A0ABT2DAB4_9BURK|nr:hypothetical protein [Massilia agilis]MCS0808245.1 hypothetical protein [Massilia agilis]
MFLQSDSRLGMRAAAFAFGMALSAGALAGDADAPGLVLSGFGTLGYVHSTEREADYTNSSMKASGAGFTRAWSPDVDSRLGAQADVQLGQRWSGVVQVVSEQRLDRRYRPRIEWANIQFQVTPELALRAGRIALPAFLAADYRKVGYAYTWVRPPVEVYGSLPLPSSDGVDLTWRYPLGEIRNTTQAFFGRTDMGLTSTTHVKVRRLSGFSQTVERGPLTARLSALTADLTLDIGRGLFDALGAFGIAGDALAGRYEVDHKRAALTSLGLAWDPGHWFIMGEAGHTHTESFLGTTTSMYATGGLRRGALTPYASVARVRADTPTSDPGLPVAGLAAASLSTAVNLNVGLNALLQTIPSQSSVSLGVRWDARRGVALKAQLDRVTPRDGSRGTLINTQPGFVPGRPLQVASLALDFVF